jgi:tryptophan-rich sensory protein
MSSIKIKNKFLKLKYFVVSFVSIVVTALLGSIFTSRNTSTWYKTINLPSIVPPSYVFPIAWNIIFILMIISLYLLLSTKTNSLENRKLRNKAINLFYIQLIFNILWSLIFFEFKLLLVGLIEIIILEILIVFCTIMFYKINKTSAYLLFPYVLWVAFATILNLLILILN